MKTVSTTDLKEGIFINELKNRFLCEVQINGVNTVCYVPSSCHLVNFVKLCGKRVLLAPTQAASSTTQYALYSFPYKRSCILLNTSLANTLIFENIKSRRFSYLGKRNSVKREHLINGYKCDVFIEDTRTIIEIKSVISLESSAIFPTVYSERTLEQLNSIKDLLNIGYTAYLIFVSLNPYINNIVIDEKTPFYGKLCECIKLGLNIKAYTCIQNDDKIKIRSEISVNL